MKKSILILILSALSFGKVFAQEVQVPFDSAGKLEVITEDIENHLQLFTNYPHFHEARLFKLTDSTFIVEVSSLSDDGKLSRNREPKTKQEVLALQHQVAEVASERSPSILLDQSSRSKFLVWETLLSVGVYAPSLLAALNTSDFSVGSGIELVVGGIGFFVPYLLTEKISMSDGQSSLALGGAFLGYGHGALIDLLVTNGSPGNEIFLVSTLTSISETAIGYSVAKAWNLSEGKSDMIRYGGFFGAVQGAGLGILINPDPSSNLIAGMTLLGSAGGFVAGTLLANDENYTRGNASTVLTAGIYGTYILPLLYGSIIATAPTFFFSNTTTVSSFERQFSLAAMIGNAGGIFLAHSLMRSRHFSTSEGNYMILGTSAGFYIGEGLALIATSKSSFSNSTSVWSVTAPIILGTAAGFGIMLAIIGKGSGEERTTGWNMNINPGALMGALVPEKSKSVNAYTPAALTVQYRW
jgi:hypothetical protein